MNSKPTHLRSTLGPFLSIVAAALLITPAASRAGDKIILSWPFGTLQEADRVTGTYGNVPGATSPFMVLLNAASQKFYRVQVE
jgi:hypothetical protein